MPATKKSPLLIPQVNLQSAIPPVVTVTTEEKKSPLSAKKSPPLTPQLNLQSAMPPPTNLVQQQAAPAAIVVPETPVQQNQAEEIKLAQTAPAKLHSSIV